MTEAPSQTNTEGKASVFSGWARTRGESRFHRERPPPNGRRLATRSAAEEPAMPVLSRIILICGLALYHRASALAQSSDTVPEALRRLFESIPAPRLPDSLGFARPGAIAMDGEGIVRVHPDAARIRVGVLSEAVTLTPIYADRSS